MWDPFRPFTKTLISSTKFYHYAQKMTCKRSLIQISHTRINVVKNTSSLFVQYCPNSPNLIIMRQIVDTQL